MSRTIRNLKIRKSLALRRLTRRTVFRNANYMRRTDPELVLRESAWFSDPDPWPPRPEGDPGSVKRMLERDYRDETVTFVISY